MKPLSNSSSATSTDTAISSKASVTNTTHNHDQIGQPTKSPVPTTINNDKPKIKGRLRVRSRKTPPPQPLSDETSRQENDVEIKNLYRFNPGKWRKILYIVYLHKCLYHTVFKSLTKTHSASLSLAKVVNYRVMARQPILDLS